MYWTNLQPHELPVRDVIAFSEGLSDEVEDHQELIKNAVAEGVAEALDQIKFK